MVKLFSILLMALPLFAAQAQDCRRLMSDVERRCSTLARSYERALLLCQSRRDACQTQGQVRTQDRCEEIAHCMAEHESTFAQVNQDNNSCDYRWDTRHERCGIRRGLFTPVAHCPGRTTINASIIGGFDSGIDGNYDCQGHANLVKSNLDKCEESREQYRQSCGAEDNFLRQHPARTEQFMAIMNSDTLQLNPRPTSAVDDAPRVRSTEPSHRDDSQSGMRRSSGRAQ